MALALSKYDNTSYINKELKMFMELILLLKGLHNCGGLF
jgi:hypothetical protein